MDQREKTMKSITSGLEQEERIENKADTAFKYQRKELVLN